jgi:hypothetical protein
VTAGTALACLFGYSLWTFANSDHYGVLDDPKVTSVVETACTTMATSVEAVPVPPPGATPDEVAATLRAQNQALKTLTKTVRAVGKATLDGDHPAQRWLADWDTLTDLRERYATDLLAGKTASFVVPTVDGVPITRRMSDSGVRCRVPQALTALPTR